MKQAHNIACCGADCGGCRAFPDECGGCRNTQGRVPWTGFLQLECCPIHVCCVLEQHRDHCGNCPQFPCRRFWDTKNPALTEEEFAADLEARRRNLQRMSGQ